VVKIKFWLQVHWLQLAKWEACARELAEVAQQRERARAKLEELRRRRLTEFMTGFRCVADRLKEMYQMITLGGDADLDLVDSMDPFSEGIAFRCAHQ